MGTPITLNFGDLTLCYCKNESWNDHSLLFQPKDIQKHTVRGYGASGDEEFIEEEIYTRKLRDVVPRLELLGYSMNSLRQIHSIKGRYGKPAYSFKQLESDFRRRSASSIPRRYLDEDSGVTDPWELARLLALNKANLDLPLTWDFHNWVENGWGKKEWLVHDLPDTARFLLLTEGSSDARILKKAFDLLRPDVADFFRFADMQQNHPFKGVGGLHEFCRGLASIGNSNFTLAIYDNDTVGVAKMSETTKLQLPKNMRIMKLPNMKEFRRFSTLGTSGKRKENINEKAVAIECFLDLNWQKTEEPEVRWTSFDGATNKYQGALIRKEEYAKRFIQLRKKDPAYSFGKLEHLLDMIVEQCIGIAGDSQISISKQYAFL